MTKTTIKTLGLSQGTHLTEGPYLSIAQAADELGITVAGVRDAANRGRIFIVSVGKLHLVRGHEVAYYRDNRTPGVGHTQRSIDIERAAEAERTGKPRGAPERPTLVIYRKAGGEQVRISRHMAMTLERLEYSGGVEHAGLLTGAVYHSTWGPDTRGKALRIIRHLRDAHLVYDIQGRDRKGAEVKTVRMSLEGADALGYCRRRGLI